MRPLRLVSVHDKIKTNRALPRSKERMVTVNAVPKVVGIHQQPVIRARAHSTGQVQIVPLVQRTAHVNLIECSSIFQEGLGLQRVGVGREINA